LASWWSTRRRRGRSIGHLNPVFPIEHSRPAAGCTLVS
jgi:hypothetical protein